MGDFDCCAWRGFDRTDIEDRVLSLVEDAREYRLDVSEVVTELVHEVTRALAWQIRDMPGFEVEGYPAHPADKARAAALQEVMSALRKL